MCLWASDAARVTVFTVELSLLFQIPSFDSINFSGSWSLLLPCDHRIVEVFWDLFIKVLVLSVVFFQVKNDLLDCFVYLSSSYIWLVQREHLSGRNIGHTERLPSFLRHVEIGNPSMGFDLFHSYQFSILFVLADQVNSFWRMDVLQSWWVRVAGARADRTHLLSLNAGPQPRKRLLLFLFLTWIHCSRSNPSASTFWRYNIFSASVIVSSGSLSERSSDFIFWFDNSAIQIVDFGQIIFLRTLFKLTILQQLKSCLSFINVFIQLSSQQVGLGLWLQPFFDLVVVYAHFDSVDGCFLLLHLLLELLICNRHVVLGCGAFHLDWQLLKRCTVIVMSHWLFLFNYLI